MANKIFYTSSNKHSFLSFLAVAWLTIFSATAVSDDTEVFVPPAGAAKILFILDASASMRNTDGRGISRINRLKNALTDLLSDTTITGVDIGMMIITNPSGSTPDINTNTSQLIYPVSDITDNRAQLIQAANAITLGVGSPWGTPTTAALHESLLYLNGSAPLRGTTLDGTAEYTSPVTSECDSSHVVLLTDGVPTPDTSLTDLLQSPPLDLNCADTGITATGDGGNCGVELTTDFFQNDQFPEFDGVQNITTHTIGFNVRNPWIEDLARNGGGVYREAQSAADLVAVFRGILSRISSATIASAPAVPLSNTSNTRDSNELYFTLFESAINPRWAGNVKKYELNDGVIVDADGDPLVINETIDPTSRSLWSATVDGDAVSAGGMAALQPAIRQWYTDAGIVAEGDGTIIPKLVTATRDIDPALLGVTTNAEAEPIVQWVMGSDSLDLNADGDTTDANNYVGDSLHSSPVIVTYESNPDINLNKQALFIANNMGVLHAIDPQTGGELWSYSPEELLPNIKAYIENDAVKHVYGLDGQIVLSSTRSEDADGTLVTDEATLFLTNRRGGNNIIALDVSNALNTADPFKVLWKIKGGEPGTDFRNLAQTWSTPELISIEEGCPDSCTSREVLMFSGGYNPIYDNTALDFPVFAAAEGHGNAIYFVDPQTGDLVWSAGLGIHHSMELDIQDSIPETPVPIDKDADGNIDLLFFSDLAGHLWRIDLDGTATNDNDLALAGGMIADLGETGKTPRFFNRPDVVLSGNSASLSSYNIIMGSGIRSSPLYIEDHNNRIFVVNDPWVFSNPVARIDDQVVNDYNYVESTTTGDRSVITPSFLAEFGEAYDNEEGGPFGFFRNLEIGEKILEETLTTGGRIFLTSYIPIENTNSCDPVIGESRLYVLDVGTGENSLPDTFGDPYHRLTSGIAPPLDIVDTGDSSGPVLVTGLDTTLLIKLLEPDVPNTFRRFFRTGWIEHID